MDAQPLSFAPGVLLLWLAQALQWARLRLARLLLVLALLMLAQSVWIPAKAVLAQALLEWRWSQALQQGRAEPPWPWADTVPVARLTRLHDGRSQIVLAGDSGRVLAFGPGWAPASAPPLSAGTSVISAHRDTHFHWLREIADQERVEIETLDGRRRYRLVDRKVVDVRSHALAVDEGRETLLLVTCWPFDAIEAGGPLRLLLRFEPESGDGPGSDQDPASASVGG
jgi:sortase A